MCVPQARSLRPVVFLSARHALLVRTAPLPEDEPAPLVKQDWRSLHRRLRSARSAPPVRCLGLRHQLASLALPGSTQPCPAPFVSTAKVACTVPLEALLSALHAPSESTPLFLHLSAPPAPAANSKRPLASQTVTRAPRAPSLHLRVCRHALCAPQERPLLTKAAACVPRATRASTLTL